MCVVDVVVEGCGVCEVEGVVCLRWRGGVWGVEGVVCFRWRGGCVRWRVWCVCSGGCGVWGVEGGAAWYCVGWRGVDRNVCQG